MMLVLYMAPYGRSVAGAVRPRLSRWGDLSRMRRTRWGSSARPAARLVRPVLPAVLSLALLVCTPGLAHADPTADSMGALIANVARANQRLENLSAEIQTEQQSVDKALVDVEAARDNAAAAEHDLEVS